MARHTHYALPSNNLCKTESFSPDFKMNTNYYSCYVPYYWNSDNAVTIFVHFLESDLFVNVIIINELPHLILLHLLCQTCTCDVNYRWNFFTDELLRGACWYRCSSRWHLLFIHYYLGVMALSRLIGETLKLTKTYGSNYVLEDTGVKLKSIELV